MNNYQDIAALVLFKITACGITFRLEYKYSYQLRTDWQLWKYLLKSVRGMCVLKATNINY